jgi:hypothetical protein
MVCRPGRPRRAEFAARFDLDPEKKWALVYVGSFGLEGVDWHRLARYPDWEFMGLYPLEGAPANYRYLKKDLSFRYSDLNASCDLVIGKLGYGLVAECLASARPSFSWAGRISPSSPCSKASWKGGGWDWKSPWSAFDRWISGRNWKS